MNPDTEITFDRRALHILIAGIILVFAILCIGSIAGLKHKAESRQDNLVLRLLHQNTGEGITVSNLIRGCMAKVNSSPDLIATFLIHPNICVDTIQPLGLRITDGHDVCRLGEEYCAFAAGYIRVVAATRAFPKTPEEVDQLKSEIDSEFQKTQQKDQ